MSTVQTIMTPNPMTIGAEARIWEAANLMLDHGISGLPVTDETGQLVGVISESDFLLRGELHTDPAKSFWRRLFSARGALAEDYSKSFGRKVGEVMSTPAVTVAAEEAVGAAALLMAERNIKRLPVVADDKVVGIVTRSDIMRSMIKDMAARSVERIDADIRRALEGELDHQRWGDHITVHVKEAIVTLEGKVTDLREKTAARVAAENTLGAIQVIDNVQVVVLPDMPVPPPGFYP